MKIGIALLSASIIVLAGCGGGGGGSNSGPVNRSPNAALALTTANVEDVSAAAISASDLALTAGADTIVFAASVESQSSDFEISDFILRTLSHLPKDAFLSSDIALSIEIPPTTVSCSDPDIGGISGQARVSGNIASDLMLTPGDRLNTEFFNCQLEPGLIADGVMNLFINSFSGDPLLENPPYSLSARVTFGGFSIAEGISSYFADGDMTMTIVVDANNVETLEATGNYLAVREGASAQVRLFNYNFTAVLNPNTNTQTVEQSGTLDSTLLGGSVNVTTLETFQGVIGENPSQGALLMTGANNSAASLVAIDQNDVEIMLDEDGDGVFAAPFTVAWDDLTL